MDKKILILLVVAVAAAAFLYFNPSVVPKAAHATPSPTPLTNLIMARDAIYSVHYKSIQRGTPFGDITTEYWVAGSVRKSHSDKPADSWVLSTPNVAYAYDSTSCQELAPQGYNDPLRTRGVALSEPFPCQVDNATVSCVSADYSINGPVHAVYWKDKGLMLSVTAENVSTEYYGFDFSALPGNEFDLPAQCT